MILKEGRGLASGRYLSISIDILEKAMATHSSTLAWKIPWKEEPRRLQSMGSRRVRQDWATSSGQKRPHLSLCPGPNVPLQGRQRSRGCILDAPEEYHRLISCMISAYSADWAVPVSQLINTMRSLPDSHLINDYQPLDHHLSTTLSSPVSRLISAF